MLNTNRAKAETPWIYPWEDRPIHRWKPRKITQASATLSHWKENAPAYRKFHASLTKIVRRSNLEFISINRWELVKYRLEYIHAKRYPQGSTG